MSQEATLNPPRPQIRRQSKPDRIDGLLAALRGLTADDLESLQARAEELEGEAQQLRRILEAVEQGSVRLPGGEDAAAGGPEGPNPLRHRGWRSQNPQNPHGKKYRTERPAPANPKRALRELVRETIEANGPGTICDIARKIVLAGFDCTPRGVRLAVAKSDWFEAKPLPDGELQVSIADWLQQERSKLANKLLGLEEFGDGHDDEDLE